MYPQLIDVWEMWKDCPLIAHYITYYIKWFPLKRFNWRQDEIIGTKSSRTRTEKVNTITVWSQCSDNLVTRFLPTDIDQDLQFPLCYSLVWLVNCFTDPLTSAILSKYTDCRAFLLCCFMAVVKLTRKKVEQVLVYNVLPLWCVL